MAQHVCACHSICFYVYPVGLALVCVWVVNHIGSASLASIPGIISYVSCFSLLSRSLESASGLLRALGSSIVAEKYYRWGSCEVPG